MLKEITINNFRSFRNETLFTMEADSDRVSEYSDRIVDINDNKILRVSSIYGPNGGGKTNLLLAITILPTIVRGGRYIIPREIQNIFCDNPYSEISVFFVDDNFEYGFYIKFKSTIDFQEDDLESKRSSFSITKFELVDESVVFRKKGNKEFLELYQRNENGIVQSEYFSGLNIKFPNLAINKTVLSKVYEDYANNESIDEEALLVINGLYNQIDSITSLNESISLPRFRYELIKQKTTKKDLIKLLANSNINISDIIYDEKRDTLYFEREIEVDGKVLKKRIQFSDESQGTKKLFGILLKLIFNINNDCIFVADDFDSKFHPKLSKAIIELFENSKSKSQLILNSHDIINMNNALFRRDEIWFVYRDESYSSILVPLSNIVNQKGEQIRKDAQYNKQYLEGRYGADPFIRKGLDWND